MKILFATLLLLLSVTMFSQKVKIDVDALIDETQISGNNENDMKIIWWIPIEFWQAIFESEQGMTQEQIDGILTVLKPYTMVAVVDGKIGPFGGVTYIPLEKIKESILLVDQKGVKHEPIKEKNINTNTQNLMSSFKPILKNMLGTMGENMHFFVFPDQDKKNERLNDPAQKGKVMLQLFEEEYSWNTPLGSVVAPKFCPIDNAKMNGSWDYCPWHGDKLTEEKK